MVNGKIYIIRNTVNEYCYIGSTTRTIEDRFYKHKRRINEKKSFNSKLYTAMRHIGKEHFFIELIENIICDTRLELFAREGYWIRYFDSFMNGYNSKVEGRTVREYYMNNKEIFIRRVRERRLKIKLLKQLPFYNE